MSGLVGNARRHVLSCRGSIISLPYNNCVFVFNVPLTTRSWETDQHTGIPNQQCVCSFCPLYEIEDEYHFVFICPLYSNVRDLYFPDKYKYCTQSLELFYEI